MTNLLKKLTAHLFERNFDNTADLDLQDFMHQADATVVSKAFDSQDAFQELMNACDTRMLGAQEPAKHGALMQLKNSFTKAKATDGAWRELNSHAAQDFAKKPVSGLKR